MSDIFETRTMIEALRQDHTTQTFLLDLLFSRSEPVDTETVDIDIVKGDERLAPFVAPVIEGKVMQSHATQTRTYKPAYVKPKWATSASEIIAKRADGAAPYGGPSPEERAMLKLAEEIAAAENTIRRREEWMAAQALATGVIPVKGEGVDYVIDMGMSSTHKIALSGTALWSDAGSDPLGDIVGWVDLVADDGDVNADVLILGAKAADALLKNEKIQKMFDVRNYALGTINPVLTRPGATWMGTIRASGVGIDVYRYTGSYRDENGVRRRMIADNAAILTSTMADFRRNYGAIQDLKAGLMPMEIFVKSWEEEDPSVRYVLAQSAPLPAPHQIDAVVSATVV